MAALAELCEGHTHELLGNTQEHICAHYNQVFSKCYHIAHMHGEFEKVS